MATQAAVASIRRSDDPVAMVTRIRHRVRDMDPGLYFLPLDEAVEWLVERIRDLEEEKSESCLIHDQLIDRLEHENTSLKKEINELEWLAILVKGE